MDEQSMFGDVYGQQQHTPSNPTAGGYTQEQVDGKCFIIYIQTCTSFILFL